MIMEVGYYYTSNTFELLCFKPEPITFDIDKWNRCPALTDSIHNAFVIKAPIGIKLIFEGTDENGSALIKLDRSSDLENDRFDEYIGIKQGDLYPSPEEPMFQILVGLGFTCNENLIMEIFPPFLEYRPNFPAVNTTAKYNIYDWLRGIAIGVLWKDSTKPIIIKRGDPLCYVRFETKKKINLKQVPYTPEMKAEATRNVNIKNLIKNHSKYLMEKAGLLRPKKWFK